MNKDNETPEDNKGMEIVNHHVNRAMKYQTPGDKSDRTTVIVSKTSGDFNLSSKRKQFQKDSYSICTTEDEKILVSSIFSFIRMQDKEAVKLLKEKFCKNYNAFAWVCVKGNRARFCDNCQDIDKIFGSDLI